MNNLYNNSNTIYLLDEFAPYWELTKKYISYMDWGYIAAEVFIDLRKAFYTVNHQILCEKLAYYGFRGKSLHLIKSFLSNRKQFVSINEFESSKLNITCGVPQWSSLRPLLILIYLNDFRFCLNNCSSNHFADDTCLIYASKRIKTLETELNTDLKAPSEWLKAKRLSLNVKKSQLIILILILILNIFLHKCRLHHCRKITCDV